MKIVCAPESYNFKLHAGVDLNIILYGHTGGNNTNSVGVPVGSVGAAAYNTIKQHQLTPEARALDLLSIALSVTVADRAVHRNKSSDGWTRKIDLSIVVNDQNFWVTQRDLLVKQLSFLTTDIWDITFLKSNTQHKYKPPDALIPLDQDCVVLLSGGLDSLIGAIDLVRQGREPYAVSQVLWGDKGTQCEFANRIGLYHLQLNHNARFLGPSENSQRARSFIFLAYGVLAATALECYRNGSHVTLYICENGFISINPPLTKFRLGSLSTRTTHPFYLKCFQEMINAAGLRVKLENPYQLITKGEMLKNCADQALLKKLSHTSTSCGRYRYYGYKHCGRCFPCLIRRAAFYAWGVRDSTKYHYSKLKGQTSFDDVRAVSMAILEAKNKGVPMWAGSTLNSALLGNTAPYEKIISRGLGELENFLKKERVI